MDNELDADRYDSIKEVYTVKKFTVTAVAVYSSIAFLSSSVYNFTLSEAGAGHVFLGIFQAFLTLLAVLSLVQLYKYKNVDFASYLVIATAFGGTIAGVVAMAGKYNIYIFVLVYGVTAFTLLRTSVALLTYIASSVIVLYLCCCVHNAGPETIWNLTLAIILSGGLLYAFSISNQAAIKKLASISRTDELTGLWNRKMFNEIFHRETASSQRNQLPLMLMIGDIDHFKKVNDTCGHEFGDKVLKSIAGILLSQLRKTDTVARWGGEEFAFIFPNTSAEGATEIVNKIIAALRSADHGKAGNVTMSFGLSEYEVGEDNISIFRRADEALFESKKKGRDRYTIK